MDRACGMHAYKIVVGTSERKKPLIICRLWWAVTKVELKINMYA
jgi:hypothetical protein